MQIATSSGVIPVTVPADLHVDLDSPPAPADSGDAPKAQAFVRGELVRLTNWGDVGFRVQGTARQRDGHGRWTDLIKVSTLDGALTGRIPPAEVHKFP
jgi:hypothetical protein